MYKIDFKFFIKCDTFTIKAVELGDLEKIKIGHDGSGLGKRLKFKKF